MTEQPTLWDMNEALLDRRYREWRATRHGRLVYDEVRQRALTLERAGVQHWGIANLFESIRYDWRVRLGTDGDGFRMNNSYRAPMVRELEADCPELRGFFEKRTRRAIA